jgi:hypothetical protein
MQEASRTRLPVWAEEREREREREEREKWSYVMFSQIMDF